MGEGQPELVLLAAGVLLVSLGVSRLGGWLGIPGLLLFLGVGLLFGSDGLGIQFQNYRLSGAIGTLTLCFILFQGGLDTNWAQTRPVVRRGLSLATVRVLGTAGMMAAFTHFAFGFPWLVAGLLGAIVSTDASAVFSVLKERKLGLKGDAPPLLEFESGGNDPMAVFLTMGVLELITHPGMSVLEIVPLFLWQMLSGGWS